MKEAAASVDRSPSTLSIAIKNNAAAAGYHWEKVLGDNEIPGYKVYKLTSPEGKVYIGVTSEQRLYNRWQYGAGYNLNKELSADIHAFGWNNFSHEVLEVLDSKAEALLKEKEYIKQFNSANPKFGYNRHANITVGYSHAEGNRVYNYETGRTKNVRAKIECLETGQVFDSMTKAGEWLGASREAIRAAIKEERPCKGFTFAKVYPDWYKPE